MDAMFESLKGETFVEIKGMEKDSDNVRFVTESGRVFNMYHDQDCCEQVRIVDVVGDPACLLGTPILRAREDVGVSAPFELEAEHPCGESCTWTFYNFATVNGFVTLRWLGESNGYYSEGVSFREDTPVKPKEPTRITADAVLDEYSHDYRALAELTARLINKSKGFPD